MNHKIVFTLSFIVICFISNAQDVIFLKNGEEIKSKVKEVTTSEIKYLKYDNLGGAIYTLLKNQVLMIKYENGSKDIFENQEAFIETTVMAKPKLSIDTLSKERQYLKGVDDANFYYKGKHSGKTGVLLTSLLLNGLFGLIPAVPCSITKPSVENLNLPNAELYRNNTNYAQGYDKQAKKIKSKKIWTNYAIGTAISTVLFLVAKSSN